MLPIISRNWWSELVLNALTPQQRRHIAQKNLSSLTSLDLAALIRIFDQNWHLIAPKKNFSSEQRHFVKEMQTVRNRWAHAGSESFPYDLVYRDLDTIQRFASMIESPGDMISKITELKQYILGKSGISKARETGQKSENSITGSSQMSEFALGQIVCLKSNPSLRGAVINIIPNEPENRYSVFINGSVQMFYASQLKIVEPVRPGLQWKALPLFHSYLTALHLRHPSLSALYSLNAGRIDFIPYQFRPVLKFIRSDRPRLLIADSVGIGKTIEAGLILRELQARRDIKSVLIICPRPLVTERKWELEMKRFDERFIHVDGSILRYCLREMDLEGVWPDQYEKVIIPYSLFDSALLYGSASQHGRRRKGLLDLDPPPRFDLVIVDEAHHIRNPNTFAHEAVRFFCNHAEAVLLITATPIQLGSDDLYILLQVLRPDLIIDRESFEHMAAPNPYINQAVSLARAQPPGWQKQAAEALREAAATSWGQAILQKDPVFQQSCHLLGERPLTQEERIALINDLEQLHTFSGIISRTRRRDIGDFTIRKPETVTVPFTPEQKQLHDELLKIQAEILTRLHGNVNVKFLMTTLRRQAASCIYGLAPLIQDILTRRLNEVIWDEIDNSIDPPEVNGFEDIKSQVNRVLEQAANIKPYDPKLETLRKIIWDKQKLPNNKVMLFSSFRHTLSYIYHHLSTDGFRVGLVHGDTVDEDRREIRKRFQLPKEDPEAFDILLFSEVGCEGLDYQFCDCIINYDLPWNPMRVDQRIGRIDRHGQRSPTVAIFNLITPGTVDADIYERCLWRIGVFHQALGECEEILGEITREIRDIAENFSLTEAQRQEKLQQLADNKIRLIREQAELEERQKEFFGLRLPLEQAEKDIGAASSYWLSPKSLQNLVTHYLQITLGKEKEYLLGEKPLKTLRLSHEARTRVLQDFRQLPRHTSPVYRDWERWLQGATPHLSLTFEAECASQNSDATFITPIHPLVRQAAAALDLEKHIVTALLCEDEAIPPGEYPFAIYQWEFYGIREDLKLVPVSQVEIITKRLIELLEKGQPLDLDPNYLTDLDIWNRLDSHHYKLWSEALQHHKEQTQELAKYRRESLTTSHRARLALLNEQLSQATDDRIRRMRASQIASAEADFARRMQEIDLGVERADIIAQAVAFGILTIKRSDSHGQ
uniref:Helicase n=1 Tax=Desulfobacca acetoxidans TaxID=60893 RepID=A0A7V4G6K1_9BACT